MYNIGAVMHWCFDCTNKCHSNYLYICVRSVMWIGLDLGQHYVIIVDWVTELMDWIGFRKMDPRPTLVQSA